jgi:membrane-anchored protein YejM (alkaline phosphatase superfamily)
MNLRGPWLVSLRPVQIWLSTRAKGYTQVVATLCLNVPILALLLARHLEGVTYLGLGGVYVLLLVFGYYALALLLLVTGVFVVAIVSRRLAVVASGALLVVALFYLIVNSVVHGIYRFHVDAFWLEYLLGSYKGLGLPPSVVGTALGVLGALTALEWGMFRVARRLPHHGRIAAGFVVVAVAAFGLSQAIHVVAYHKSDPRIIGITPQLPFFYPLTSYSQAVKYGDLIPLASDAGDLSTRDGIRSFTYPMRPVRCPARPRGHSPTS